MLSLLLTAALAVLGFMVLLFIIAQIIRNNSIVDSAWGLGFIMVMICLFSQRPEIYPAKLLLSVLNTYN